MATALLKRSLLRSQCRRQFTYFSSKRSSEYEQVSNTGYMLCRLERYSRLKQSDLLKTKYTMFPSPNSISARFCSNSSSSESPQKVWLVRWYLHMLEKWPIATKGITSALIYTAADFTSQTIVGGLQQYDWIRTLRMAGFGMIVVGPALHFWYSLMARHFPNRDVASTLKKCALGQTTFGPGLTVVFFSVNAALQGETGSEIIARLKRDFIPTLINGLVYWPICDFVNYKFTPVNLQPLVINLCSYLWTVYMTYMASLKKAAPSNEQAEAEAEAEAKQLVDAE